MRIGLFTAAQWSPEENPAAVLKALREQVRAARDNGFSSLFVGQHLLTGRWACSRPTRCSAISWTTRPACRSAPASCCCR